MVVSRYVKPRYRASLTIRPYLKNAQSVRGMESRERAVGCVSEPWRDAKKAYVKTSESGVGAVVCRTSPAGGLSSLTTGLLLPTSVVSVELAEVVLVFSEVVLVFPELSGVVREERMVAIRGEMAQRRGRG